MDITLKSEQADLVQQQINSGKYHTPEEVISEALQLLSQRNRDYEEWVEETRNKVDIAIEELRQGEGIDGEFVVAQLKEKINKARKS
ncbi:type II toxin-antitoxin system ParD family antitoxin [Roseofilum reptotaenium CS-1145]|uniref:CopG family transcriptional regulator n=1 Tax=Roseofilum reptotaenium AO1-A TaxID=1925591 RepID=A0A1L9QLC4_9CYAN|nr:type II toxin-antitoxin system ParD family antitoxin [Roseofilum reptotaenium]MDB9516550.1 type II toxin-antitoxin system ParD family antitoxin [Roseofilum reptotaenium CS-1145]OJJ19652.1 CopG family transcriptional regulator [Roseofilum reptotaenium AO1-A]